jgi:plasmid stabilization system protein ParE
MPPVEVRWTLRARRDVRAIRDYIAQASPVSGRHVAARLFDRADLLAEHPPRGGGRRSTTTPRSVSSWSRRTGSSTATRKEAQSSTC